MPRAIWSGAISFGLVSVPVKLYPAVSRKSVRFNQLDGRTMQRVKQKRVNADGDEVPYEEIVKGYEVMRDSYVVITDEDLQSVAPKASRTIDIVDFVEEADIDPVFYDAGYYLVPDELARKSYMLLTQAMADDGRVAIASFVMRTKQYLAAIRPTDGKLMISTMVYADELVDADEIPGLEDLDEIAVSDAERAMAHQLIESLATDFDADKYHDTYREKLMAMIEKKTRANLLRSKLPPPQNPRALWIFWQPSKKAWKRPRRHASAIQQLGIRLQARRPAKRNRPRKRPSESRPNRGAGLLASLDGSGADCGNG